MSFFKRILTVFGILKENLEEQFNVELKNLKDIQIQALLPGVNIEDISPEIVLNHTGKIKELIVKLQRKGLLNKDDKTVNYVLSNIAMQENTIVSFGKGYSNDVSIFASQIAAGISEILKDIALLLH